MARKDKRIELTIVMHANGNCRSSTQSEIVFLQELNRLIDGHRDLMEHKDVLVPQVLEECYDENYTSQVKLRFTVTHRDQGLFPYARMHYLLTEIGNLCKSHTKEPYAGYTPFHVETYLNLKNMPQPWVMVVGPKQVLLRDGAAEYHASDDEIPAQFETYNSSIDGMMVLGEPIAVEDFRRAWKFQVDSHRQRMSVEELTALEARGMPSGPTLRMDMMKVQHPGIQWQHLTVWLHSSMHGQDIWYEVSLNSKNEEVRVGVQYTNLHHMDMLMGDLPYDWSVDKSKVYLRGLKVVEFEALPVPPREVAAEPTHGFDVVEDGVPVTVDAEWELVADELEKQ